MVNEECEDKKEYTTVDLMKFIFAICVVGIHTSLLHVNESYFAWLFSSLVCRSGVPFFFVISGFFLAKKIFCCKSSDKDMIRVITGNYCKKLFPPLIIWGGGIGLIANIIEHIYSGSDLLHILFYACRTFFYPENAMWYLWALITGSVIITEIYIKFEKWQICWAVISIIGYGIVLLSNNYYFMISATDLGNILHFFVKLCKSARNGVLYAPFYIGYGFVLQSMHQSGLLTRKKKLTLIGLIVGTALLLIEASCIYDKSYLDDRGVFISQTLLIPSVAAVCICYDVKLKLPYGLLRRLSASIYFLHRTIRLIIISLPIYNGNEIELFLGTLGISIIVALISYRIDSRRVHLVFG